MFLTRLFACFITLTSMSMAAVAAWDRGGSTVDRALLVALSIAIIAAAHLLPAVSRRPVSWLLWVGCVLCAIYGHLVFFTNASLRASDVRVEKSRDIAGLERQILTTKEALAAIIARPVAVVAAEYATEKRKRERDALRVEMNEANRAGVLRERLVTLTSNASNAGVTSATDPVTSLLSAVTGGSISGIMLFIGIFFSVLLELVGALVWYEAINGVTQKVTNVTRDSTIPVTKVTDVTRDSILPGTDTAANEPLIIPIPAVTGIQLAFSEEDLLPKNNESASGIQLNGDHDPTLLEMLEELRQGLRDGKCRPTVTSIREYLNCGQSKARELRRIVMPTGGEA